MERFLNVSREVISHKWSYIYHLSGENDMLLYFSSLIIGLVTYLLANSIFAVLDLTGRPAFLYKYKIQDSKTHPIKVKDYLKALTVGLFNIIVVGIVCLLLILPLMKWRGIKFDHNLPSLFQLLIQFLIFLVILEIFFYYSHRLFHHPLLYSKVHKIHHQWTVPISISSVYCHPLEQLICNLWPIVAGPVLLGDLCGNHIISAWLWIIFTLTSTTVMHSGYHFPFMLSPQAHDFHHRRFNKNYGSLGILDYIHGTSVEFHKSPYYKYHRIICTLSPVKRLILSEKSDD